MNSMAKILCLGAFAFIFVYNVDCHFKLIQSNLANSTTNGTSNDTLHSNTSTKESYIEHKLKSNLTKSAKQRLLELIKKADAIKLKHHRTKRQLAYGGFAVGWGGYDYNSYYGDYTQDYAYDYYDWVCSEKECQLCGVLTSECCDPQSDVNCFLPDSCLNNPCMAGGTCVSTLTPTGDYKDFVCICLPGLTGKYCQSTTDYLVGAQMIVPPQARRPPAVIGGVSPHAGHRFAMNQPLGSGSLNDQMNGMGLPNGLSSDKETIDTTTVSTSSRRPNFRGFGIPKTSEGQTQSESTTTVEPSGDVKADSEAPSDDPKTNSEVSSENSDSKFLSTTSKSTVEPSGDVKADTKAPSDDSKTNSEVSSENSDGKFLSTTSKSTVEPSGDVKADTKAASGDSKVNSQESSVKSDENVLASTTTLKPDSTTTTPAKAKNLKIIKPLGAKRIKCDEGKIFSSAANQCVEFALSRTRQVMPIMDVNEINNNQAYIVHIPPTFIQA